VGLRPVASMPAAHVPELVLADRQCPLDSRALSSALVPCTGALRHASQVLPPCQLRLARVPAPQDQRALPFQLPLAQHTIPVLRWPAKAREGCAISSSTSQRDEHGPLLYWLHPSMAAPRAKTSHPPAPVQPLPLPLPEARRALAAAHRLPARRTGRSSGSTRGNL
jgi:hypothetical protein